MAQSASDQSQANGANSSQTNTNNTLTQPEQSLRVQGEVDDSGNYDIPGPPPVTRVWDNKIWKIEVRQHPLRARMCGFGDKDRRPISPPPCVQLRVFDATTQQEIDYKQVADLTKLVLMVDLWNLHGSREDNCVKHTTSSPSISSTSISNYPHVLTGRDPANLAHDYIPSNMAATYGAQPFTSPTTSAPNSAASYYPTNGHHAYANGGPGISDAASYGAQPFASPTTSAPNSAASYYPTNGHHAYANGGAPSYTQRNSQDMGIPSNGGAPSYTQRNSQDMGIPSNGSVRDGSYGTQTFTSPTTSTPSSAASYYPTNGHHAYANGAPSYTQRNSQDMGIPSNGSVRDARETTIARNLIGSSSAGANLLFDDSGETGIWFVLQDISVRTEGWFRLKMNLFNLQQLTFNLEEGNRAPLASGGELLNEAPCLASAFSRPFKVYSAKKFPGVIESTELSKTFANQGVKIPVRKDHGAPKKRKAGNSNGELSITLAPETNE
ncbi:hypothetical protein LTR67_001594 [Exophiala xenobiotica]